MSKLTAALRFRNVDQVVTILDGYVHQLAYEWYWNGADHDDVCQVVRLAVADAARIYHGKLEDSAFMAFAALCARRQCASQLKLSQADRRRANHGALSWDAPVDESHTLAETVPGNVSVEASVFARQEAFELLAVAARLSDLEREAFRVAVLGLPYVGDKSMDNALQRMRRKLTELPPAARRSGVLLVCRDAYPSKGAAIQQAERVLGECTVTSIRPRKVRHGRVVAPQGRPGADGSLGRPVWSLEVAA